MFADFKLRELQGNIWIKNGLSAIFVPDPKYAIDISVNFIFRVPH
jgi:hypothetical protein